ncbi:hypothetical protein L6Q96_21665 [Candidatus Binatia bacterium]|nr:hypothetical protein [Candidatus Binatia bacterium]
MADAEVKVDGLRVSVGWDGRTLLAGEVRIEPEASGRAAALVVEGRDRTISVRVEPAAGAPVAAAWLDLRWVGPPAGPLAVWVPHLRPGPEDVVADHAARSPVAALQDDAVRILLLPDLDAPRVLPWAFDADLNDPRGARLGFGATGWVQRDHIYFRADSAKATERPFGLAVRIVVEPSGAEPLESACARWTWRVYGEPRVARARTQALPFAEHAARAYAAAFADEWLVAESGGVPIGGPIHYSAGGTAIFFQSWFNALRSAVGVALLGRRLQRADLTARAEAVANLVEQMPAGPLLPTWYDHEARRWWGVGDDLIFTWAARDADVLRFFHLPDVCETARWMIVWNELVAPRAEFEARLRQIGEFLAAAQLADGSLPSYFDWQTLQPGPRLCAVAQSAVAGPILLATGHRAAAARLADFLCRAVVPTRRYFDFETFFSDSYKPLDFADPHTGIPPQNTLSMAWTAEFLMKIGGGGTGDEAQRAAWRAGGRRALDQLCLYQQLWEPPFLSYRSFGGFGVMNTDGEWSDARQALFGLLLLDAYEVFGEPEYFLRGVAALRAGFALQAIPENRDICPTAYDGSCPNWPRERLWDFDWNGPPERMGRLPAGKMVENYAHAAYDAPGVRTGFDWGEGSAATGALVATERFGDIYVDRQRGNVFGIDGVNVAGRPDRYETDDFTGAPRGLRIKVRQPT